MSKPDHLLETSTRGSLARRELGQNFERRVSRLYESLGVEIGYIYRSSPVIVPDAVAAPADDTCNYIPTTWGGARLPSVFDIHGRAIFDDLAYDSFTLLVMGGDESEVKALTNAANSRGVPLKVIEVADAHIRRLYEKSYVLVRPDQHVCWRSDVAPADSLRLIDTVRGAE